jgi:hypothetical protein
MLKTIPPAFNYKDYADLNIDLYSAFGYNENMLKYHYTVSGQFENRKYCNIDDNFNWKKYIDFVNFDPSQFGNKLLYGKHDAFYNYLHYGKEVLTNLQIENNFFSESEDNDKEIIIVYFAYLYPNKDWRNIVYGQLSDIITSGILKKAIIHVVLSGSPDYIFEAKNFISTMIDKNLYFKELHYNNFEFDALQYLTSLAHENQDKIFIYLHSKGMVNHNPSPFRTQLEIKLTRNTLLHWEDTLYMFQKNKFVNKAGLIPSTEGFFWFNFWWARASYIIKINPLIDEEFSETNKNDIIPYDDNKKRFKCEGWLGNGKNWLDCYSLIYKKITYIPIEKAVDELFSQTG